MGVVSPVGSPSVLCHMLLHCRAGRDGWLSPLPQAWRNQLARNGPHCLLCWWHHAVATPGKGKQLWKLLKFGGDFLPQKPPDSFLDWFTGCHSWANFCCYRMAQLVNKYRCKRMSLFLLAAGHVLIVSVGSGIWWVWCPEPSAADKHRSGSVRANIEAWKKNVLGCAWQRQCKGWRLSMAGRKDRKRIPLNEFIGLSSSI